MKGQNSEVASVQKFRSTKIDINILARNSVNEIRTRDAALTMCVHYPVEPLGLSVEDGYTHTHTSRSQMDTQVHRRADIQCVCVCECVCEREMPDAQICTQTQT